MITFLGSIISLKQLAVFVKGKVWGDQDVTGSAYLDAIPLWLFPHLEESEPNNFVGQQGTGGEGNILQHPASVVSAATAHKTFGPTDLTSTYSVCTRRLFGGIELKPSSLESDALTTRLPSTTELGRANENP
ncbi:uncharacterized protein TNCV_884711 [Trichonephila clavipes]|nr:uncharacterized protein TNCV_884711 [Trichonephila clavipes]